MALHLQVIIDYYKYNIDAPHESKFTTREVLRQYRGKNLIFHKVKV